MKICTQLRIREIHDFISKFNHTTLYNRLIAESINFFDCHRLRSIHFSLDNRKNLYIIATAVVKSVVRQLNKAQPDNDNPKIHEDEPCCNPRQTHRFSFSVAVDCQILRCKSART